MKIVDHLTPLDRSETQQCRDECESADDPANIRLKLADDLGVKVDWNTLYGGVLLVHFELFSSASLPHILPVGGGPLEREVKYNNHMAGPCAHPQSQQ